MIRDEALGFASVEVAEFLAIDGGHGGFGGEKIIGMRRMGKEGVKALCSVSMGFRPISALTGQSRRWWQMR